MLWALFFVGLIILLGLARHSSAKPSPRPAPPRSTPLGPGETSASLPKTPVRTIGPAATAPVANSSIIYHDVLRELLQGDRNVFLAGRAGTGKSTLLRSMLSSAPHGTVVLAPTGIAALNVGGSTIHRFFKFPPRYLQANDIQISRTSRFWNAIRIVVIDEVSMVRSDVMNAIDLALRRNRRGDAPFGGVRMILIGDMGQLPPIVRTDEQEALRDQFGGPFFHDVSAVKNSEWVTIELRTVFRQSEKRFVEILDRMRSGVPEAVDLEALEARIERGEDDALTLTSRNARAAEINRDHLDALPGPSFIYSALIEGEFPEKDYPAEKDLTLKVGARVMLLRNDPDERWANGTMAEVTRLSRGNVWVKIAGREYDIAQAVWDKIDYEYDSERQTISPKVVASFRQLPLRLAWAVTIHKSQGQSFDSVHIDLPDRLWEHGQLYVALSRCRSLQRLSLSRAVSRVDIRVNQAAFGFFEDVFLEDHGAFATGEKLPKR